MVSSLLTINEVSYSIHLILKNGGAYRKNVRPVQRPKCDFTGLWG